jgi:hypothetical protein
MKNLILFSTLLGSLTFVGCSSAYKTAQTPDDVYFSEGPVAKAYEEKQSDKPAEGYSSYWEKQDDDYLRMKVQDRNRWSEIDDIDYWQGYNNNNWVNYNSGFNNWNSPFGMNAWNRPMGWNNGWGMSAGWGMGNMWGMNNGWGMGNMWGMNNGWGMGNMWGMGNGWNNWGLGFNSWNNNWSNPWCWNQPVRVINKYPVGSRTTSALAPYSNYTYSRPSLNGKNRNSGSVNPGVSRSIWDGNGTLNSNDRSGNSMYRTINRSSGNGSGSSYDRPARVFDGGGNTNSGSSGGSRSSGGSSSGGSSSSSSGGSSRGGRGG